MDPDQVNVSPPHSTENKSSYSYLVQQSLQNNSPRVHVRPPQASDTSAQSQLVKREGRNLHRRCVCRRGVDIRRRWHPCSYFCLSPALSCVTERACRVVYALLAWSHMRDIPFSVFRKLTNMYSQLWRRRYLPAPGLLWQCCFQKVKNGG